MTRSLCAGIVAAALLAGLLIGRQFGPERIHETTVTKTVEVAAKSVDHAEATAGNVRVVEGPGRVVTRTVYTPGPAGPVRTVERVVERGRVVTEAHQESASATKAVEVQWKDREVFKDRLVEAARPGWALGAAVGMGLDGHREAQAEVSRRLFGGLWVTAGVATTRTAAVGLRMEF